MLIGDSRKKSSTNIGFDEPSRKSCDSIGETSFAASSFANLKSVWIPRYASFEKVPDFIDTFDGVRFFIFRRPLAPYGGKMNDTTPYNSMIYTQIAQKIDIFMARKTHKTP